jgi:hypothetical protein
MHASTDPLQQDKAATLAAVGGRVPARDERRDRRTRLAAVILAAVVLALFAVASVLLLAGCGTTCSGYGGISRYAGNGYYVCNDGTWEVG